MKIGVKLTKEIAEPLYVAIETDTGGFRFKGTAPATHRLAATFLEKALIRVISILNFMRMNPQ